MTMKIHKTILAFILILGFVPSAVFAASGPQYFGYFDGVSQDEAGLAAATHMNLSWASLPEDIEWAREHNMKAIVSMIGDDWRHADTYYTDSNPTWMLRVNSLRPHMDNVAAFFMVDEPQVYINDWPTLKATLEAAAAGYKRYFPDTPLYVNFSPSAGGVWGFGTMPTGIDWVGIDCYGPWESCSGEHSNFLTEYAALKSYKLPNQKIVLIPQAFITNTTQTEAELSVMANRYFDLAKSDPDVIAVMPFEWFYNGDYPGEPSWVGLVGLLSLQQTFAQIGDQIIYANSSISVSPISVMAGQSVTVSWKGSVSRFDWMSLATVGSGPLSYVDSLYMNTCLSPTVPAGANAVFSGSCTFAVPYPGTYEFRFQAGNVWNQVAASNAFTVSSPTSTPTSTPAPTPVYSYPTPSTPMVSPLPNMPPSVSPDGILVKSNSTIYVMENGKKRGFTSMSVFLDLGYKLSNVSSSDASSVPEGPVMSTANQRHPRGTLAVSQGTVYFLGAYLRYPFPSAEVFLSWANRFQDLVPANSFDLAIPQGAIVQKK